MQPCFERIQSTLVESVYLKTFFNPFFFLRIRTCFFKYALLQNKHLSWSFSFWLNPYLVLLFLVSVKFALKLVVSPYLTTFVITTSKTFSITECVMFCLNESRCKSLNFRLKDKSCDLNSANKRTHPRDFGPKEGSVYMNKVWYWRIL